MKSKWFSLKHKAVDLRKQGFSIRDIENQLGIPRSTLSGWLRDITLNALQKRILKKRWREALGVARGRAIVWHNKQKAHRLELAESEAKKVLAKIKTDEQIIELALAMIYLGEGFKKGLTGLGNSDPLILKFFLRTICTLYKLDIKKMRFDLHLRADQNPDAMKKYWAEELDAPIDRFSYVAVDLRTKGRPTYTDYKGVCLISCGNVAIQRKLIYLGRAFCERIIKDLRV